MLVFFSRKEEVHLVLVGRELVLAQERPEVALEDLAVLERGDVVAAELVERLAVDVVHVPLVRGERATAAATAAAAARALVNKNMEAMALAMVEE